MQFLKFPITTCSIGKQRQNILDLGSGYPDSRLIPAELRKDSIAVEITGTRPGKYFLVPYEGKLKNFTDKRPTVIVSVICKTSSFLKIFIKKERHRNSLSLYFTERKKRLLKHLCMP